MPTFFRKRVIFPDGDILANAPRRPVNFRKCYPCERARIPYFRIVDFAPRMILVS